MFGSRRDNVNDTCYGSIDATSRREKRNTVILSIRLVCLSLDASFINIIEQTKKQFAI